MPRPTKRSRHSIKIQANLSINNHSSNDSDSDDLNNSFDQVDLNNNFRYTAKNASTQTCLDVKDEQSQTSEFGKANLITNIQSKLSLETVGDLVSILIDSIPEFGATQRRILSLIVFILLRVLGYSWESCEKILSALRLFTAQTCNIWVNNIIEEENACAVLRDERGSYQRSRFYDEFPELEQEAKSFALDGACRKTVVLTPKNYRNLLTSGFARCI